MSIINFLYTLAILSAVISVFCIGFACGRTERRRPSYRVPHLRRDYK